MWIQTTNGDPAGTNSRNLCLQPVQGRVGIGTMGPSYTLDVNGDFRIQPYYKICSGVIDVTGKTNGHYHKFTFGGAPGSVGQGIHVFLYRSVHDNGSWWGSLAFECIFFPAYYGHLDTSRWFIIRNFSRSGNGVGKVYCHGRWSYGAIWLNGGRNYRYVIINGSPPSDSNESISSAETVADGSAGWSDDRIKHNEIHIDNALSVIEQLKPQKVSQSCLTELPNEVKLLT